MTDVDGEILKISSIGTISVPKQYRRQLEMQKGDHILMSLEKDHLVIRKVQIS